MERVQPAQLGNRKLVVVDAQVDDRVGQVSVARVLFDYQQRGRLLTAAVAAGLLRGGQALDEALGQRQVSVRLEGHRQRVDGLSRDEDVSLCRIAVSRPSSGPLVALRAGVARRAT